MARQLDTHDTESRALWLLRECADKLACEIEGRYAGTLAHPIMKQRFDRDMDCVAQARSLLASMDEDDDTGSAPLHAGLMICAAPSQRAL